MGNWRELQEVREGVGEEERSGVGKILTLAEAVQLTL